VTVREIGVLLLVAAALTWVALACADSAPEAAKPTATPGRDMAGPGYIPEGTPREAPPAPRPRAGAVSIDFNTLSYYDYDPEVDLIPDEVLALDGKRVELRGVMYYGVDDPDRVTEFYLMPNHMVCCYGIPRHNEIVEVVLKPETHTQYVLNYYLIRGVMRVGAVRDDQDRVLYLYRIEDAAAEIME
jgi:hypothetical protein